MELCKRIDEETIELHAMDRLQDASIREHLDHCNSCVARVAESRVWIAKLKRGLRDLQEARDAVLATELKPEQRDDLNVVKDSASSLLKI